MRGKRNAPISRALRQAIAESGISFKRLEEETGVLRQSLMKFARGEQSLRGDLMDRLAAFFGLELRRKRKSKKG
jgi:transcriptional regulator with XRE-family HTH domain